VSDAPAEVHVERLLLRVAGLDEQAAQALAQRVAEGLAPSLGRVSAGAGLDHLRVQVPAAMQGNAGGTPPAPRGAHPQAGGAHPDAGGETPEQLAQRIVERVARMLAREHGLGSIGGEATL
jgi:hypothetical protein